MTAAFELDIVMVVAAISLTAVDLVDLVEGFPTRVDDA